MVQRAKKEHSNKHTYWQKHIEDWRLSGQTQQRYCHERGIALATFGYWRRKLKEGSIEKPRFYPLVLSGQPSSSKPVPTSSSSLRVVLGGNRFIIEIDDHFSPAVLREVVTTLEQL